MELEKLKVSDRITLGKPRPMHASDRKPDIMKKSITALVVATVALCRVHSHAFTNADFEAGNIGFSSDYQFAVGNSAEGQFTVRSDPQNWNEEFVNFGDHTTGAGKMLVVNGATAGSPAIWRQTISVQTNTAYSFEAWTGTAVAGGPANLLLKIDGVQIGQSFVLPDATGSWVRWEQGWTSSTNAVATFEIINANTSRFPNDFYIDDLKLLEAPPELFIRLDGNEIELRWHANPAWKVFTSSSVTNGSWNVVTNIPTANGILYTLRLPIKARQEFFRLQKIP